MIDLSELTRDDIDRMEKWVDNTNIICPWEEGEEDNAVIINNCKVCNILFPKCMAEEACPCNVYGKSYVLRRVRGFIKKWYAMKGKR